MHIEFKIIVLLITTLFTIMYTEGQIYSNSGYLKYKMCLATLFLFG